MCAAPLRVGLLPPPNGRSRVVDGGPLHPTPENWRGLCESRLPVHRYARPNASCAEGVPTSRWECVWTAPPRLCDASPDRLCASLLQIYQKKNLTPALLAAVRHEVSVHGRCVHPHVLPLLAAFEDGGYLCIVTW